MRRRVWFLCLLLAVVPTACAKRTEEESLAAAPALYTVAIGEEFELQLPSNPTTGFRWELAGSLDGRILRLVRSQYEASAPGSIGAGGTELFTFEGVGAGRTVLSLVYRRPWEKDVEPARTATYSVVVE